MVKIIRLKILTLTLESNRPIKGNSSQLRGFFANKFSEHVLFHHHRGVNKFIYQYPKIQSKMINGIPTIIGINEGTDVLKEIYDKYDEIQLAGNIYSISGKGIILKEEDFGITSENIKYEFLTPWFALNGENYRRYKDSNSREQIQLLKKILIGNILSMAKGLKYVVTEGIKVEDLRLEIQDVKVKDIKMIGFKGDFDINFNLPNYIGLGKMASRGFGTIIKTSIEMP